MHDLSHWDVIVVDDEPDNLGVVELVLDFNNAVVRTASSGMMCIKLMEQQTPTLLLVDIQMPEMSGVDLLHIIRERPRWHDIPTIAVTAHAMMGDYERYIGAGFDGYIAKPINAMTLVEELLTILATKEKS